MIRLSGTSEMCVCKEGEGEIAACDGRALLWEKKKSSKSSGFDFKCGRTYRSFTATRVLFITSSTRMKDVT